MRRLPIAVAALLAAAPAWAENRFPRPQFRSGYAEPLTTVPPPRALSLEVLDVLVLATALAVAAHLALRARSRRGLLLLSVFSVLYFGLYRRGCVCGVGSLQNAVLGLADASYPVPLTVLAFFLLPLAFALLFGRSFCAGVCPLGAVQDLAVFRPVRVPGAVRRALGLTAHAYLGLAVVAAAVGAGFLVCRYDPFVPLFRMSGSASLLLAGGLFLAAGTVLARPYCSFLCPYGVLLGWASVVSRRHPTVTPGECVRCRLCEGACPFGAIRGPQEGSAVEERPRARRRLALLLLALPALAVGGAALGSALGGPLASLHPAVSLSDRLRAEEAGTVQGTTPESDAFRQSLQPLADLEEEAGRTRRGMGRGAAAGGAFLGLAVGARLIAPSVRRRRDDYRPDRGSCLSCGRCFDSCPVEHLRRHGDDDAYRALQERIRRSSSLAPAEAEAAARRLAELADAPAPLSTREDRP